MNRSLNIIRLLIILSVIFLTAYAMGAQSRGIHIVSKQGKDLYLYKDYTSPSFPSMSMETMTPPRLLPAQNGISGSGTRKTTSKST